MILNRFCYAALAIALLPLTSDAQTSPQPAVLAQQAVAYVSKAFLPDPTLGKKLVLPTNGEWAVTGKLTTPPPEDCKAAGSLCLQVIYRVAAMNVDCRWTVLFSTAATGAKPVDPLVVDENADAAHYTVRTIFSPGTTFHTNGPPPVYPPIVVAAHVEGHVKLEVIVGANGDARTIQMISGPEMLRASAIDAARRTTFDPMKVGSQAISWKGVVEYDYRYESGATKGIVSAP